MDEKRLGHYQLRRCLGEGGMGRVYLAHDTQLERDVAVKVIAPELVGDRDLMARFRVEAIAQARLNHPNIVTIYSFGQEAGAYVIVMEYVAGKTLKQLIQEEGKLSPAAALRIATSILDALSFAHAKGILHRDIKPANIFVSDDGIVKLGDFGIAKVEGLDGLTRVGTMVGTPHYSSPEQIRALKMKPATDIYSLSVTLFEMLTGLLPFGTPGSSDLEIRKGHLEKTAPAPSSLCPGLSPRLDAIIARGLAKKPEERFANALEYRQAISAVLQTRKMPVPDIGSLLEPRADFGQDPESAKVAIDQSPVAPDVRGQVVVAGPVGSTPAPASGVDGSLRCRRTGRRSARPVSCAHPRPSGEWNAPPAPRDGARMS